LYPIVARAMSLTLQSIFEACYPAFEQTHLLPDYVRLAAWCIMHCRTSVMGGHVRKCPNGCVERAHYNSCRHRACNLCQWVDVENWVRKQGEKLLNCVHYHVVFTIPEEFDELWLKNVKEMGDLLFQSARDTLLELLADPKYLGATPGILASLQTWSATQTLHPHVHTIVTGGGLTDDGRWRTVKKRCLLPRAVPMRVFRGKFCDAVRRAAVQGALVFPEGMRLQQVHNLLNKLGPQTWNVDIGDPYEDPERVLRYLARYLRQGSLSNPSLLSFDGERVTFEYKDNRTKDARGRPVRRPLTLPVEEFLQRVLLHVPVPGAHYSRAFGLYANGNTERLNAARVLLGQVPKEDLAPLSLEEFSVLLEMDFEMACPVCGRRLAIVASFERTHPPPNGEEAVA